MSQRIWQVKNRETGLVVSEWLSQFDALQDKQLRDDEWWEIEPVEESKLIVEGHYTDRSLDEG